MNSTKRRPALIGECEIMDAKWKRSTDLAWEQLGREALVVNPQSGMRWTLNALGAVVWRLCDGSLDSAGIAAALANAGGRSRREIREDVERFCSALAHAGLMQPAAAKALPAASVEFARMGSDAPGFRSIGLSGHARRRPSPSGVSGPV
jgi:hypothetical protein